MSEKPQAHSRRYIEALQWAALLHDAIEDAEVSQEQIAERFGERVARIAADQAHNARDQMLDARRDPTSWDRFNAGIDGTAWYQLRIHQILKRRLPDSRSTELLGEALQELLDSPAYRQAVPEGIAPAVWAAGHAEREGKGVAGGAVDPVAQEPIRLAP